MEKNNKYTVVGYYENNGNIFVEHVKARDTNDAVVKAVTGIGLTHDTDNICIVEIFKGYLTGLNETISVSSACDWPGVEDVFIGRGLGVLK